MVDYNLRHLNRSVSIEEMGYVLYLSTRSLKINPPRVTGLQLRRTSDARHSHSPDSLQRRVMLLPTTGIRGIMSRDYKAMV